MRVLLQASSRYMNCFLSPLLTVVAKNVAFFAGSLLAVLIALTIYDEDVLAVEHVLSSITLLGVCITVCRCVCVSVCVLSYLKGSGHSFTFSLSPQVFYPR